MYIYIYSSNNRRGGELESGGRTDPTAIAVATAVSGAREAAVGVYDIRIYGEVII